MNSALASLPDTLDAALGQAARTLAPAEREACREAVAALWRLGRGEALALALARQAPAIAGAIGAAALPGLARELCLLASKTSASVLELIVDAAPLAAARLGDAGLFAAYLDLLAQVAARAPRGLRPMLGQQGALLGQLTLGGLRRWVQWGLQAHRADLDAQARYFGLASADALAVLKRERRGTLLVDVGRRVGMYVRALFGCSLALRPTAGDYESRAGRRPAIGAGELHLPDAFDDQHGVAGIDIYRACAVHAAAHLVFGVAALPLAGATPLQRAAVGVFEDARVEALAIARFPALRALWTPLHTVTARDRDCAADWLDRVARALLDPGYDDAHPLVAAARAGFAGRAATITADGIVRLGLELARALEPHGGAPAPDSGRLAYRDDNRYAFDFVAAAPDSGRRYVSLMEMVNTLDTGLEGGGETWVLASELFPYEDMGLSFNGAARPSPAAAPLAYPEWDYLARQERPAWTRVFDTLAAPGDADVVEAVLARHRPLLGRLRRLAEALRPRGMQRLRRQEEGDELDLDAAIGAVSDMARGAAPDGRVMSRQRRSERDIAVLILLDLSESTRQVLPGGQRIVDLALEAAALSADTLARIGDSFALHGFQSAGRHAVHYQRFKDFGEAYGAPAKARLAGMRGALSTRMGAAIRHASALLARQPQRQKLLLVLTDGEPADIDVADPLYLRHDARRAVEQAAARGIASFCLSLDPGAGADACAAQVFGAGRYQVLERIERLPERLPRLYGALTRRR